jgi:hypothetical protein
MKSLIPRMLVSTAIAIVSLASTGNVMAASPHHNARVVAAQAPYRQQAPLDVAAIPPYPNYSSKASPAPHFRAGYNVAGRPPYQQWGRGPVAGPGINVGQLVGAMLGMVPPQYAGIVQSAMKQAASHRSSGSASGTYDPSFDSPSTSMPIDNSASDAAAASAAAVSEQNLNDDSAMTASMAAAEQENDAANAAALQTEINAGM